MLRTTPHAMPDAPAPGLPCRPRRCRRPSRGRAPRAPSRGGRRSRGRGCRRRRRHSVMMRVAHGNCLLGQCRVTIDGAPYHARTGQPAMPPRRSRLASARRPRRARRRPRRLGTNEIARRTGVNASTVSRLLATLADDGYVAHVAAAAGTAWAAPGPAREHRPRPARPPRARAAALEALVAGDRRDRNALRPGEHEAITVDFARSPASVQGVAQVGRPSVAHATAAGKVMLAFGGRASDGPLPVYTRGRSRSARRSSGRGRARPRSQAPSSGG